MSKEWVVEHIEDFRAGGGVKTVLRRFAQTAPFAAAGLGFGGFMMGEVGPGIGDLLNTSSPTTNVPATATSGYAPEYGPQWAEVGVGVGIVGATVEAVMHPFFIGRRIREGDLDEIPDMPHLGHLVVGGLRRGFDHVVNFPRDFGEGGGWREMQLNLAVFIPGGVILGGGGGLGADAVVSNYYEGALSAFQDIPVPATALLVGGMGVGAALGGVLAAEVTAAAARDDRRIQEGFTTPRTLWRRRKEEKNST